MKPGIQPRAYETIAAKGSYKGEPTANVASISFAAAWSAGDTVIIIGNAYAYSTILGVSIPGIDPALIQFQGMTDSSPFQQLFTVVGSPIDFSGNITVTRATAGHLRVIVQVYSGVGRIIPQDSQLPAFPASNTSAPIPGGPVTVTIPGTFVVGTFSLIGVAVVTQAPAPRVWLASAISGTWGYQGLADLSAPAAGTYDAYISATIASGTYYWTRFGFGLEPRLIGPAPDFTLTASTSNVSVDQGDSSSLFVDINPVGSFADPVNLQVTGLPSGVTASWSANPATIGSTLTLTASAGAAALTTPLTITGTSGTLTDSIQVWLTVNQVTPPEPPEPLDPRLLRLATGLLLLKIPVEVPPQ